MVRTQSDDEAELLKKDKVGEVFVGEHEPALGMARHVLARMGAQIPGEPARLHEWPEETAIQRQARRGDA